MFAGWEDSVEGLKGQRKGKPTERGLAGEGCGILEERRGSSDGGSEIEDNVGGRQGEPLVIQGQPALKGEAPVHVVGEPGTCKMATELKLETVYFW